MAKGKQGSSDRKATVAKAGKKSGNTVYPERISPERQAAKEQGEQQFISKTPLSIERTGTVIVYNKKTGLFEYATKTISIPSEHNFDPARGRVVYSPSFKEKEARNK